MFIGHKRAAARRAFRIWADLLAALGLLVAVDTYFSINENSAIGLPLGLAFALAVLGYLAGCCIAAVVWSVRRRWSRASTCAIKAFAFFVLIGPCARAGDYVHLALFYPVYSQTIEARKDGDRGPVRFDWGDKALWVTDGFQGETLIYDPEDALAASVDAAPGTDEQGLYISVRHLIGHFYLEYRSSFFTL